jgi:hypothetical protein
MKRLITLCAVAAMMVFVTSLACALPSDNFDDNSRNTSLWNLYEDNHDNAWLEEIHERLELRSTAVVEDKAAVYVANGWGLSTTDNFSFKIDFHNSFTSGGFYTWATVFLGLGKGSDLATIRANNAIVDAAWDRGDEGDSPPYSVFNYSYSTDGNEIWSDHGTRDPTDGTLYVSYDTGADELYLSPTGYGEDDASATISGLLKGEWGADVVTPFLGGDVENVALDSGVAYLDNFVVDSGTFVPEPATVCLLGLGGVALLRKRRV